MTDKQTLFIEHYLTHFNATKAAIEAGYSEATARSIASEILTRKDIRKIVDARIKEKAEYTLRSDIIKINPDIKESLKEMIGEENISGFIEYLIYDYLDGQDLQEVIKRRRRNVTKDSRYAVLERAGFKCQACGARPEKENNVVLQIDHIIPFSMGGSCAEDNYQVLCWDCNISKGNGYMINHNEEEDD